MIFSLINCGLELFTFANKCFRGFEDIKYYFLVNSAFLLPFFVSLTFVCVQLDTGLEIFHLISGQKVCHYLGGDKGGGMSRQTVTREGGGQKLGFLQWYTF